MRGRLIDYLFKKVKEFEAPASDFTDDELMTDAISMADDILKLFELEQPDKSIEFKVNHYD